MTPLEIILIITTVLFGVGGIFLGSFLRKKNAEAKIGSAEQEAKRIVDEAATGVNGNALHVSLAISSAEDTVWYGHGATLPS